MVVHPFHEEKAENALSGMAKEQLLNCLRTNVHSLCKLHCSLMVT